MWVNISFQPDEEQKGAHLLHSPAPGWLTSSSLGKRLPQLSWHVRVTMASIVPKHQLWLIQWTYTIHGHAYLASSSSFFGFSVSDPFITLWDSNWLLRPHAVCCTAFCSDRKKFQAQQKECLYHFEFIQSNVKTWTHIRLRVHSCHWVTHQPLVHCYFNLKEREVAIWDSSWP